MDDPHRDSPDVPVPSQSSSEDERGGARSELGPAAAAEAAGAATGTGGGDKRLVGVSDRDRRDEFEGLAFALLRDGAYGGFVLNADLASPQFGRLQFVSARFADMLGWPVELLVGQALWRIRAPKDAEQARAGLRKAATSGEWPSEITQPFTHRSTGEIHLSIRYRVDTRAPFDAAGRPTRVLGFAIPVDVALEESPLLLQKYDELRQVHEDLRQANDQLHRLLAMLAHDLKSGMAAVLGLADALDSRLSRTLESIGEPPVIDMATRKLPARSVMPGGPSVPPHRAPTPSADERDSDCTVPRRQIRAWADMAYHANRAAHSVQSMIDDLVTLKALQVGKSRMRPEPVPVRRLLREIAASTQHDFERKGVTFEIDRGDPDGQPLTLTADRQACELLLRNLLTNACKFTPPGKRVTLSVHREDDGAICFTVRDEGVGIAMEKIANLFDVASPTSTPGTNGERGTGFGLPICHEIMAAHGGVLLVESEPGVGSTFIARFPQPPPTLSTTTQTTPPSPPR